MTRNPWPRPVNQKDRDRAGFSQRLDSILESIGSDDTPPVLYHYTDWDGLEGIVRSRCFRFFAHDCMGDKDKDELQHADAAILEVANGLREGSSRAGKRFLDEFLRRCQQTKASEFSTVYLACFSKARDRDSFWRKFQREGSGVCLGIRVLQEKPVADDRLRGGLIQVVHMEQTSRVSIRSSFDRILWELQNYVAGQRQDEGWAMGQALTILLASLAVQEIRTKKEEFAEEEEWRFALFPRYPDHESLDEKSINGRRYVERHMRSQGRPLALAELLLGSGLTGGLAAAEEKARRILSDAGYPDPGAEMPEIAPSSCSLDDVQPPASHASSLRRSAGA